MAVHDFLNHEAELLDAHEYRSWLEMWEDDGIYWVPASDRSADDPDSAINIIYDNRRRIERRVAQLETGLRHAQIPASRLVRTIGTISATASDEGVDVRMAFVLVESRREQHVWSGRVEYALRARDEGFGIRQKKVLLVDPRKPLRTLAFLP
ncbi:Aromatic-ring-hydroxylating dioxygenase, beta subunit [Euzebya pacifica]|uniref:Aromatic-ring-hydroxylating dioxygenase, beta subunit n=1 Tax=Euzebya pacifica TaxID=1608957 RepID=A0A346XWU3_9ACTN|nr:Aromatic-ring-hydroxylating dioxygenase, beta subunit [Euzebya pacifica]